MQTERKKEREGVYASQKKKNDENEMKQLLISFYVAVLFSKEKWQLAGGSRLNEIPKECIKCTIHHNIFCFSFILMNQNGNERRGNQSQAAAAAATAAANVNGLEQVEEIVEKLALE